MTTSPTKSFVLRAIADSTWDLGNKVLYDLCKAPSITEAQPDKFAVYAVRKREVTPLIQTDMTFKRLMDDIVVPFNPEETFLSTGPGQAHGP